MCTPLTDVHELFLRTSFAARAYTLNFAFVSMIGKSYITLCLSLIGALDKGVKYVLS